MKGGLAVCDGLAAVFAHCRESCQRGIGLIWPAHA